MQRQWVLYLQAFVSASLEILYCFVINRCVIQYLNHCLSLYVNPFRKTCNVKSWVSVFFINLSCFHSWVGGSGDRCGGVGYHLIQIPSCSHFKQTTLQRGKKKKKSRTIWLFYCEIGMLKNNPASAEGCRAFSVFRW